MISPATVEVRNNTFNAPVLYLAPFGAEELSRRLPVRPHEMPYEGAQNARELAELSPERLASGLAALEHVTVFGIYSGSVEPDQFLGTVETKAFYQGTTKEGDMKYHRITQELGTQVYRTSEHGKGYGTLGKYAAMEYARSQDQTHAFTALTSVENTPAHRSLAKLGFVQQGVSPRPIMQANGRIAKVQHWMLMDTLALSAFEGDPTMQAKFRPGWERYLTLATRYSVSIC